MQQPALARSTVDRCSASRSDDEWLRRAWATNGRVLVLDAELHAAIEPGEPPSLIWESASPEWGAEPPADAVLLGADETGAFWALDRPSVPGEDASNRKGLRDIGQQLPARDSGLFTHAVAVITWHRSHTHCPRCGAPTESAQAGAVRVCTLDGSEHFPRVDPAMIVLVCSPDGGQAVLGRGTNWPHPFFSCLAGFVEPGETLEEAVRREVLEEVGLACARVKYFASQPWPFPSSLMIGCHAMALTEQIVIDKDEIEEARWFGREELELMLARKHPQGLTAPPPIAIAHHLIWDFVEHGRRVLD